MNSSSINCIFVHKRKQKRRSQFHKLSHESFCCMHFEMFQVKTFNIEILFHVSFYNVKSSMIKIAGGDIYRRFLRRFSHKP